MRARLVVASASLLSLGFVPPNAQQEIDPTGIWEATGTHPDGSGYAGKAIIERLARDRYRITFEMPNGTFHALCLRADDVLGCGWGASEKNLAAALYRASGSGWIGVVRRAEDDANGRETLTGGEDDATGTLTIDAGTRADGTSYTGLMRAAASAGVHRISWDRGGHIELGYGIRDGRYLATGFGPGVGAALYRISRRSIHGIWMDPMTPTLGAGEETLVR